MLSNSHCYLNFFLLLVLSRLTESAAKIFKPGKPLNNEEFSFAAKFHSKFHLVLFEELHMDWNFLEDDIINSFMASQYSIEHYLWTDGVVPYLLDEQYDNKGRLLIARAFQELQNKTCIRFVPRVDQTDYIEIAYDEGCSSYVGRLGGAQTVSLGRSCYSLGIILHELMHTLGFIHEHCRTDRDRYVTVMWDNIKQGKPRRHEISPYNREDNFKIWPWYTDSILKVKYDYSSILHYGRFTFSRDPSKKPTLVPKSAKADIGQRKFLSRKDVLKINTAYRCPFSK